MFTSQVIWSVTFALLTWNLSVHVAHGQDEICSAYNISKGETLQADCENVCDVGTTVEVFDWAAANVDEPNIIDRTTVCRCTLPSTVEGEEGEVTFECFEVTPNVWDTSVGVLSCEEYNITSGTTCKEFCLDIDPIAFDFSGSVGAIQCGCGTPLIQICEDSGAWSLRNYNLMAFGMSLVVTFVSAFAR